MVRRSPLERLRPWILLADFGTCRFHHWNQRRTCSRLSICPETIELGGPGLEVGLAVCFLALTERMTVTVSGEGDKLSDMVTVYRRFMRTRLETAGVEARKLSPDR